MTEQFSNTQPIYLQIVARLCRQIVRNEFQSGDKLPSVRELALQFGVNPNTIQRVNMELEKMGIVESRRGQGMFVTQDTKQIQAMREQLKEEQLKRFVQEIRDLGYSDAEILDSVRLVLQ